jgi:ectoine hydroxylase-related dioxygenase (phytanoyl-CoA dioxygenase family)
MQLTQDQIDHFRQQGWLAIENFWNPQEIAAMRKELDRLKIDGKLRNVCTEEDGVTPTAAAQNLQLCPLAPHSPLFKAMPHAPKAVAAVSQLIGAPNILHLDQVFLKPGKIGAGTNWHQDNAYFHIDEPLKGTAMWTAVHDATIENGTLSVVPESFDRDLPHERDPNSDHHIRCWPDMDKAKAIEVPAGSVIFFCYCTPHSTGDNVTDFERAGVALHYLHADQNGIARGGFEVADRRPVANADSSSASPDASQHWLELTLA